MLAVGTIQFFAALAVWIGHRWGFWVGIASVCANAAAQVMFLSDYAGLAVALLGLDALVLLSLMTTFGEPR